MRLRGGIAVSLLVLVAAAPAFATSSRADYAAQVNPICTSANDQADQVYLDLGDRIHAIKSKKKRARNFDKLFFQAFRSTQRIYAAALAQLELVAPAPGDEALVSQWIANQHLLGDLNDQVGQVEKRLSRLSRQLGKKLRSISAFRKLEGRIRKMEHRSDRLSSQILDVTDVHVNLGTQLGVTSCLSGARGLGGLAG